MGEEGCKWAAEAGICQTVKDGRVWRSVFICISSELAYRKGNLNVEWERRLFFLWMYVASRSFQLHFNFHFKHCKSFRLQQRASVDVLSTFSTLSQSQTFTYQVTLHLILAGKPSTGCSPLSKVPAAHLEHASRYFLHITMASTIQPRSVPSHTSSINHPGLSSEPTTPSPEAKTISGSKNLIPYLYYGYFNSIDTSTWGTRPYNPASSSFPTLITQTSDVNLYQLLHQHPNGPIYHVQFVPDRQPVAPMASTTRLLPVSELYL